MTEKDEPDWYRVDPEPDSMADAAASMRDAAEMLRDAATPGPPPKESNWSFDWFFNWVRYTENGKSFKRAAFTSGPAFALLLWYYANDSGNGPGSAAVFFAMAVGIGHLIFRRPVTRWALWGAVLAPLYYLPAFISIIVGIAITLAGGA